MLKIALKSFRRGRSYPRFLNNLNNYQILMGIKILVNLVKISLTRLRDKIFNMCQLKMEFILLKINQRCIHRELPQANLLYLDNPLN